MVDSYKDCVQHILRSSDSFGIKFDSKFNELFYFHVCHPGLPPCLGYDLLEEVVSYDLALCICDLLTNQKLFTYTELNRRLNHLRYLGKGANNKPRSKSWK